MGHGHRAGRNTEQGEALEVMQVKGWEMGANYIQLQMCLSPVVASPQ